jgi:hypothetical protein
MPIVNQDPSLINMFREIDTRLRRLESSKAFNIPYVTADPNLPNDGDMWINTSVGANGKLFVRKNGANIAIYTF